MQERPSAPAAVFHERPALVRRAFALEWISLAWMSIEAAVATGAAPAAHSVSLLTFGIDSLIELASGLVVIWRLVVELKRGHAFSERAEQAARRIGGALLFALALYVAAAAGLSLWQREGEAFSAPGLAVTLAAIPIMGWLARRKLQIAEKLGSRALRADAAESIACLYLSGVVALGFLAQRALGAWWIDGVTSLGILYFLVKEGREAWSASSCSDD